MIHQSGITKFPVMIFRNTLQPSISISSRKGKFCPNCGIKKIVNQKIQAELMKNRK